MSSECFWKKRKPQGCSYQAEFGMVDGVDDWVVHRGTLGEQSRQHGDDGCDVILVEEQTLAKTQKKRGQLIQCNHDT